MDKKSSRLEWQKAQKWEKGFWDKKVEHSKKFWDNKVGHWWSLERFGLLRALGKRLLRDGPGDDCNYWWAQQFNNYTLIPKVLENVVEFGCGPFTNLRIVLKGRLAKHVFASDPLARHYVTYKGFQLTTKWKRREYLIDDHPLEETPFRSNYFDLVICINVLDHVQNPYLCLEQLVRVTKTGGFIIYGQDLTNEEDLRLINSDIRKQHEIGHPHFFGDPEVLLKYFDKFDSVINKTLNREQGRSPGWHYGTLLFLGKKK